MTGNEWQLGTGQLAVDDVQVGAAERACSDLDEDLTVTVHWIGDSAFAKGGAGRVENHSPHGGTS